MPVGPPTTRTDSACLRPAPSYSVLDARASFATHHGPLGLAARPHALTSCGSERSVATARTTNRSKRALLAEPAAARAAIATAAAATFTSRRDDRRGLRRAAPARQQVAIPVEAVLRDALERREVDVHDPESLRVAERPLEVVEQA